jgi:hypothetical protein
MINCEINQKTRAELFDYVFANAKEIKQTNFTCN